MSTRKKVWLAAALCLVSVICMILALTVGHKTVVRFTPPPFDETAVKGVPSLTENDGYSKLDAKEYAFAVCGKLTLSGDAVDVWLTNPESNTVLLKVRMMDSYGEMLGETGLVKPGEYIQRVNLTTIPSKDTKVTLKVMAYEPDSYHSAGNVALTTDLTVTGE